MLAHKLTRRDTLRTLAAMGAGLAAMPLLAACQPKVVKETVLVEKEKVVEQTVVVEKAADAPEIRVMTRPGPLGIFMSEFAKRYAQDTGSVRAKIEYGNWEDMSTKLMTAGVAGTLADIFWQDYFLVPTHFYNGMMYDLQPFMDAAAVDTSIWYPWALEMEYWDDKLYGLPLSVNIGYHKLIYNKESLAKAGVPEPDGPNNTWADLINIAKGVKENTGAWGIDIGHWWWGTESLFNNRGTQLVRYMEDTCDLTDEKTVQVLKMVYETGNVDKVMPTASAIEGDRNKMFVAGKLAIMCNCAADLVCGMAEAIGGRFAYGYTSIPQKDFGLLGAFRMPNSIHVYAKSKYPEECFGICREISGVEASKWTALSTGMTPGACPAAWTDPEVVAKYPLYGEEGKWLESNEPPKENTPMPKNLRFWEFNSAWSSEWVPIKNGERPFDSKNLDEINKVFNQILQKPIV